MKKRTPEQTLYFICFEDYQTSMVVLRVVGRNEFPTKSGKEGIKGLAQCWHNYLNSISKWNWYSLHGIFLRSILPYFTFKRNQVGEGTFSYRTIRGQFCGKLLSKYGSLDPSPIIVLLCHGLTNWLTYSCFWGFIDVTWPLLLMIVSSVRSSNSHPDLLLTQHHPPHFFRFSMSAII